MNLETLRHWHLRRMVSTAAGALGLRASTAVAERLAAGVHRLNTPGRRRAELRLRAAAGAAVHGDGIARTIADMYRHAARFWVEALFIRRMLRPSSWRKFVRVEGESRLRELAEARRGCVIATAYYGNPAVAAVALGRLFRPLHVVVDLLDQPVLRAWQRDLYADQDTVPIDRRTAGAGVPDVLRGGGAVLLIAEHERRRGRGVACRFLGADLNCAPTVGRLSAWSGAPIAVVTCRRERSPFTFAVQLHDVIEPPRAESDYAAPVRRTMTELHAAIMSDPAQYLWTLPIRSAEPTTPAAGAALRTQHASGGRRAASPPTPRRGPAGAVPIRGACPRAVT